jgi:hypothetical protein
MVLSLVETLIRRAASGNEEDTCPLPFPQFKLAVVIVVEVWD